MDVREQYSYEDAKLPEYTRELIDLLKLQATPVAMKFFKNKREMEAVEKIRIPKEGEMYTACQLVAQSTRLNYTVGFSNDTMPTLQCSGVLGFIDPHHFRESTHLDGAWYGDREGALKHQQAAFLPKERYEAVATSPMVLGRLKDPDVCLLYGTPQQVMFMCCGVQYNGYESMTATFLGESSCTDSWIRPLLTGKPCFTIPCYGERRFGNVLENELLFTCPPEYIPKIVDGIKKLSKNGMRYPVTPYGIQNDVAKGMGAFYDLDALRRKS